MFSHISYSNPVIIEVCDHHNLVTSLQQALGQLDKIKRIANWSLGLKYIFNIIKYSYEEQV